MNTHLVSVSGGLGSPVPMAVRGREVLGLADAFDAVAGSVASLSARAAAALGDVHLLESAALAPHSFAEVEAAMALLSAEMLACAAMWRAAASGARELVRTLQVADGASAAAMHGVDQLLARAAVLDPLAATAVVLADPPLFQRVVGGLPSPLLERLLGGRSETAVRVVPGVRTCGRSPSGVAELLERLDQVNRMDHGTIDVQTHRRPDGTRVHVAYLPGTDRMWSLGFTSDVRDLKENGRLLHDVPTAHGAGVARALDLAGVAPGERVLLVGHSQGGMVSAQLLAHGSGHDVTNVVTAGSPIAGAGPYPPGSHVLSLENRADLVPSLDGAGNPPTREQVTVTFDDGPDDPVGSHELSHYVAGAASVDSSADPAVRESLASLQPFFAPAEVTSRLFVITRAASSQH